MNEDQNLQNLFDRIHTDVSASDQLKSRVDNHLRTRHPLPTRFRLAMAGGILATASIVIAVVTILPTASAAGAYVRMKEAIADAKYMHIRSYSRFPGKPQHLVGEIFYSKGAWRSDAFPGTRLARSMILVGNNQWMYQEKTDVSVQVPVTTSFLQETSTALEFAKAMEDDGVINSSRDFSIEARPNEGQQSVYAIVATRKDTPYHLEMIVDQATNLPIRSTFSGMSKASPAYREVIEEFTFGQKPDHEVFSPKIKASTAVLNLRNEARSLCEAWRVPLQTLRAGTTYVDVRNLAINSDGDIFIACSFGKGTTSRSEAFPKNLLPESIKDDKGRAYELVATHRPGGVFGDTRAEDYFRFGPDRLVVTEFAPIRPLAPWPPASSIDISFVSRTWTAYPTYYDQSIRASTNMKLPAPIASHFPVYSSAMLLDDVHLSFEECASVLRAEAYEKSEDFGQAARWYRDAAERAKPLSSATKYLDKAAHCDGLLDEYPIP